MLVTEDNRKLNCCYTLRLAALPIMLLVYMCFTHFASVKTYDIYTGLCNMSASKYLLSSDQTWSHKLKNILNNRKTANLLFRKLKLEFVMSMTSTCWRLFNMHSFDAILYNGVAM